MEGSFAVPAGEWLTGEWWLSDATANALIGRTIYLHPGQLMASHAGGEIISVSTVPGNPKRKTFRFRRDQSCSGVVTPKAGWANEKKIVWRT